MSALAFDTLRYANRLEEVGVTREQAAVHAETMAELVSNELATKKDIEELRLATSRDIESLKLAVSRDIESLKFNVSRDIEELRMITSRDIEVLRLEMKNLESRVIIKVGSMIAASIAITVTLLKLL